MKETPITISGQTYSRAERQSHGSVLYTFDALRSEAGDEPFQMSVDCKRRINWTNNWFHIFAARDAGTVREECYGPTTYNHVTFFLKEEEEEEEPEGGWDWIREADANYNARIRAGVERYNR